MEPIRKKRYHCAKCQSDRYGVPMEMSCDIPCVGVINVPVCPDCVKLEVETIGQKFAGVSIEVKCKDRSIFSEDSFVPKTWAKEIMTINYHWEKDCVELELAKGRVKNLINQMSQRIFNDLGKHYTIGISYHNRSENRPTVIIHCSPKEYNRIMDYLSDQFPGWVDIISLNRADRGTVL